MDLNTYLTALRRGWALVLALIITGGAVATFFAYREAPIYAAQVGFYISTPNVNNSTALSTDQFAQDRANSYAKLLSSQRLGETISADSKLGLTGPQVAGEITGSAELNTVLVTATVHDASRSRALAIARATAGAFPKMIDRLDNTGSTTSVSLHVVSGPQVGNFPISPRKKLMIALGLIIGFVLGLVAAVGRHLLDTSVRGAESLEEIVGAPTLATVPLDSSARAAPLVVQSADWSARGEALRQLRTGLQFVDAALGVQIVVVTSAVAGEGKSTTATNLALVMAESGRRTLLIEADLRRPKVAEYLDLEGAVGLTNVLANLVPLDDVLQTWGPDGLIVLVSGTRPPNPSELLSSPAMPRLLAALRDRFDFIIIDSPPLLPVTDGAVLAAEADGALLVFRDGKTRRPQLVSAVRTLHSVDARILGAVLNMRPLRRSDKRAYAAYAAYPPSADEEGLGRDTLPRMRTKHRLSDKKQTQETEVALREAVNRSVIGSTESTGDDVADDTVNGSAESPVITVSANGVATRSSSNGARDLRHDDSETAVREPAVGQGQANKPQQAAAGKRQQAASNRNQSTGKRRQPANKRQQAANKRAQAATSSRTPSFVSRDPRDGRSTD